MKYFVKYHAIVITLGLMATLAVALPVSAQDYQFQQVISGYDCTHSTIATAEGQANNINCAVFSPSIDEFSASGGRPIIRGVYDSVHSTALSVTFNGKVYLLGEDVELVQNGNLWVLDLSGIPLAITPGSYSILVEMTNQLGQIVSATRTVDISLIQPEPIPTPFAPLSPTGQNSYITVVVGLSTISFSAMVFMLHKHIRKKEVK